METELDLDALPALASLARRWKRAHDEGLAHVEAIPDLFAAAAAAASEEGRGFESSPSSSSSAAAPAPEPSRAGEVVRRAALAAPSPRLAAFLAAGRRHPSAIAEAPQKLTDAISGAIRAARAADAIALEAEATLAEFRSALGSSADRPARDGAAAGSTTAPPHHRRHHWIDDVPAGVLLARVPWGAEHRTVEQWAWLCEAAVEGALAESAAARAVAEYLGRGGPPGGGGEGEEEAEEALEEGKLRGCAEVWRLRAYVDEELLEALARGGE
jgi:hypothetical protein